MTPCPVVDLQGQACELAQRLGSLKSFLSASQELLNTIRHLARDLFKRQSKKIVTLTEISRSTLIRSGTKLYEFASCPASMRPYKSIYFEVLRALKERQQEIVESCRNGRLERLLYPLSTWLVIRRGESSQSECSSPGSVTPPPPIVHRPSFTGPPSQRSRPASTALMPPPPLLPHEYKAAIRGCPRHQEAPVIDIRPQTRAPSPRRSRRVQADKDIDKDDEKESDGDDEQDGSAIVLRYPRPSRQFGIFCTGSKTRPRKRSVSKA